MNTNIRTLNSKGQDMNRTSSRPLSFLLKFLGVLLAAYACLKGMNQT